MGGEDGTDAEGSLVQGRVMAGAGDGEPGDGGRANLVDEDEQRVSVLPGTAGPAGAS